MRLRLFFIYWMLVPLAMRSADVRPSLDILSIVTHADRMYFRVDRPGGRGDGAPFKDDIVMDSRRDHLVAVAEKLKQGHSAPQGYRSLILGDPWAAFFVDDKFVLKLWEYGDRIICSNEKVSVDWYVGRKGISDLKALFERFQKANQSPEPTVMSVTPRADARVAPATTVAHL